MKRMLPFLVAALVLTAPAHAKNVLESQTQTYPAKSLKSVQINFTVGRLLIEGTDADEVVVKLIVHCKRDEGRCEELAEDLRLDVRARGDQLDISVEGNSFFDADDFWVEGVIQAPSRLRLDIDMPVGEVEIRDMKSDVDLRLKIGEATIDMSEDHVSRVHAGVTIGEVTVDKRDGREHVEGLFGRKISWIEGRGQARVDLQIGIGEANVRLN